jgi:integrase
MTDLYTVPATCHVCTKAFKARYNVGDRAKVCTPPTHSCKPGTKGGRKTSCVGDCCRSRYRLGAAAAAMDSAIDSRKVLSGEEYDKTWAATKKLRDPEGITIRFISSTGCRLEEARIVRAGALQWQDGPISTVRIPTLKRKGRPLRGVHIDNRGEFAKELLEWSGALKADELLFPVARRTLQEAVEKILDKVKPDRESLVHLFRHTRASRLIAAGADWNYVRQQLGWANLEMAKRYVHTDQAAVAKVLGKL